jgi:hypothetical protein
MQLAGDNRAAISVSEPFPAGSPISLIGCCIIGSVMTTLPMEPMSFWQLVENSPEWVGVFANALFAVVTIGVVIWQVCVMKAQVRVMQWQGRNSARHERLQNRLLRLQHEHEWLLRLNAEREQLLKLARKLHLAAYGLKVTQSNADALNWQEVQDTAYELASRLEILDIAAFTGKNDNWYPNLTRYVDAVQQAVVEDSKFNKTYSEKPDSPNLSTRKALQAAAERYEPIKIFLDLESAIRMEFFDFKSKWDTALPS